MPWFVQNETTNHANGLHCDHNGSARLALTDLPDFRFVPLKGILQGVRSYFAGLHCSGRNFIDSTTVVFLARLRLLDALRKNVTALTTKRQ